MLLDDLLKPGNIIKEGEIIMNIKSLVNDEMRSLKQEIACGLSEIFGLGKMSDEEIFAKYKYLHWNGLNFMTRHYFVARYNIAINSRGCYVHRHYGSRDVFEDEPIGKIFEESILKKEETSTNQTPIH